VVDGAAGVRRTLAASPFVYPLLLAAYPVAFLAARNLDEALDPSGVLTVLAVVLAATTAVWLVARVLLHDAARASFATVALVVPFFVFGHVKAWIDPYGPHAATRYLFIGFVALMVAGVVVAARARWIGGVARVANPVAAVLVLLNLVPIAASLLGPDPAAASGAHPGAPTVTLPATPPAARPDVYYLIFDRYASARVLREQFGYDDEPFLDELRARGFTVLDDAFSNYPRTTPSLASSLNMMYLDEMVRVHGEDSIDWGALNALIDGPVVAQTFARLGYRTINAGSWWNVTAEDPRADANLSFFPVDEFTYAFRETTMWPMLARYTGIAEPDALHRDIWEATPRQFDAIAGIAEDPGPTFTFAHFLLPHPPEVFLADGRYAEDQPPLPSDERYRQQVTYANREILALLDRLQGASPDQQPIIVLQADEGPYPEALMADEPHYDFFEATQPDLERKQLILSAIALPGMPGDTVPPTLTPVNTFRLIFDRYFGANLPLLPDRAYVLRSNQRPYEFLDVTGRLRPAPPPA
jgi:hypothetical protein